MDGTVAVLIPSYKRPDGVKRVLASLKVANEIDFPYYAKPYVICEPGDHATQRAALDGGACLIINQHAANYAGAINTGFEQVTESLLFAGADDLEFHPGWLTHACRVYQSDPTIEVVGTADLINPYVAMGLHATHYFFRRQYIDEIGGTWEQGPGVVMYEELDHQYTDTAFIGIARARGVFSPCMASVVEHLHFSAGKSAHDETYDRAYRHELADRARYLDLKEQWKHLLNDDVL